MDFVTVTQSLNKPNQFYSLKKYAAIGWIIIIDQFKSSPSGCNWHIVWSTNSMWILSLTIEYGSKFPFQSFPEREYVLTKPNTANTEESVPITTNCWISLGFLYSSPKFLCYAIFLAPIFCFWSNMIFWNNNSKMRQMLNDWDASRELESKGRHKNLRCDSCPSDLWIVFEIRFPFLLNSCTILWQLGFHWLQGSLAMGIRCSLESPSAHPHVQFPPKCLYFLEQIRVEIYILTLQHQFGESVSLP